MTRAAVAVRMHRLLGDALARRDPAAAQAARAHATAHGLQLDAARAAALDGRWRADARTLRQAGDEMARLGATARARRVALAIRDLGRHTPVPRPAAGALLTAVEAQVAAHVAGGLTNRQVAERVHLSPKTVEVYLTRIYAKTGCRSRGRAGGGVPRRGGGRATEPSRGFPTTRRAAGRFEWRHGARAVPPRDRTTPRLEPRWPR